MQFAVCNPWNRFFIFFLLMNAACKPLLNPTSGFVVKSDSKTFNTKKSSIMNGSVRDINIDKVQDPICKLPGDPTFSLSTNVDLGDKKLDIMKGNVY
jgi:hypothetical protein